LAVVKSKPFSSTKLQQLRQNTIEDPELRCVSSYTRDGWPGSMAECDTAAKRYWQIRNDLAMVGDLVLYRQALVIPKDMRPEVLNRIHDGHMGQSKCLSRARGQVFWPGVSADIRQKVENCVACQTYQRRNPEDKPLEHAIPDEPWHKIAIDLFQLAGENYLLAACYYSGFPEIVRLQGTTSGHIIIALKTMFARYGIPLIVMSDNAPNLVSFEVNSFFSSWGVKHDTSSPYIARSNGLAERNIQTVKQQLKKSSIANDDPFLALLAIRSSPLASGESPAELFFRRRIRSSVICLREEEKLDQLSPEASSRFDVGQQVRIYDHITKKYDKQGVITQKVAPRSVNIQTEGGCYRRNDQDLRKTVTDVDLDPTFDELGDPWTTQVTESKIPDTDPEGGEVITNERNLQTEMQRTEEPDGDVTRTRRGRIIRKPARYLMGEV
jgi:hypothetical protein